MINVRVNPFLNAKYTVGKMLEVLKSLLKLRFNQKEIHYMLNHFAGNKLIS